LPLDIRAVRRLLFAYFKGRYERRWSGWLLLGVLLIYGFAPTYVAQWHGDRIGARMESASFWPEDVSFVGTNVLILEQQSHTCTTLCETLFDRSGAAGVYLSSTGRYDLPTPLDAQFLSDPALEVSRVYSETVDSGYTYFRRNNDVSLPDDLNWIFIVDSAARYAKVNAAEFGLDAQDRRYLSHGLYLYRVVPSDTEGEVSVTAVARMFVGRRTDIPKFLPMFGTTSRSNDARPFNDALETWICGPLTADWEDRCPYLF